MACAPSAPVSGGFSEQYRNRSGMAVLTVVFGPPATGRPSSRPTPSTPHDGDDAQVSTQLQDDFRTTGLTHLLAVSGTNLTLLVGFVLALAGLAACGTMIRRKR